MMSSDENLMRLKLMLALLKNNVESLKHILKNPVDICFHLPPDLTEGHLSVDLVSLLKGLNDEKSNSYVSPKKERIDISLFSDVIKSHSEYTPLHLAVRYCDLDIISLLLEKGADPNSINSDNETPLINRFINKKINFLNLVELFVKYGADITYQGGKDNHNVLHKAVIYYKKDLHDDDEYNCSDKTFKWLVTNGVDINSRTSSGQTCLHIAVLRGRKDLVSELDCLGAKCLKDYNNQTPLHFVPGRKIVELFMSDEVDTNIRDINGYTALHLNAKRGFPYLYSFLNSYSNLNLKNRDGSTVLHITCKKKERNCFFGAAQPLFDLCTILQYGGDVNIPDNNGFTPYYYLLQSSGNYEFEDEIIDPYSYLSIDGNWQSNPREMFILYLYKLHKVGMLVEEKPCLDMFNKDWLEKYDKKCDKELNEMAHYLIDEYNILFSQLLTNDINRILDYNSKNPGLLKCLSEMTLEIGELFPLYSYIIQNQVHKASLQLYYLRVRKIGEFILHQILPSMPSVVIGNILKFLPPDEVMDLNGAIKKTTKINPRKRKFAK